MNDDDNNNNSEENNQNHQNNQLSTEMELKLPQQIVENILLEGVDSTEFIQNTDIVQFSNILATLRMDLSVLMNEDIDEFQFQFSLFYI